MNSKDLFLLIGIFCTVFFTVHSLECYTCFYDVNRPDLSDLISSEECIQKDFDGENVKTDTEFDRCYTAVAIDKDGDIVSAHRGGGAASLDSFYVLVSRDEDDFGLKYCYDDLCNGAPSMMTSVGLMISVFTIAFTRYLFL
ncbi:UNVERIFIED_CONTAM: hypothetical protein RMT77_013419 [Armadillidium vulgare]